MTKSLWDLTLQEAVEQTASRQPTPGGGSIAPVAASLGLSLVLMALEIVEARTPLPGLTAALAEGRTRLKHLQALADEDIEVFAAYLEARRLPKETPSQVEIRAAQIELATLRAAEKPLAGAEQMAEALQFAADSAQLVTAHVLSDVLAGADLLLGATLAELRNVEINTQALKNPQLQARLYAGMTMVRESAPRIHGELMLAMKAPGLP